MQSHRDDFLAKTDRVTVLIEHGQIDVINAFHVHRQTDDVTGKTGRYGGTERVQCVFIFSPVHDVTRVTSNVFTFTMDTLVAETCVILAFKSFASR